MTAVDGTCSCYRKSISESSGRDQLCADSASHHPSHSPFTLGVFAGTDRGDVQPVKQLWPREMLALPGADRRVGRLDRRQSCSRT
jgi:hypothetical protein